jgi:hypothetical protein
VLSVIKKMYMIGLVKNKSINKFVMLSDMSSILGYTLAGDLPGP